MKEKVIAYKIGHDVNDAMAALDLNKVFLITKVTDQTTLAELKNSDGMLVIDMIQEEIPESGGVKKENQEEPEPVPAEEKNRSISDDIREFVAANFGSSGEKELEQVDKPSAKRGRPKKENQI